MKPGTSGAEGQVRGLGKKGQAVTGAERSSISLGSLQHSCLSTVSLTDNGDGEQSRDRECPSAQDPNGDKLSLMGAKRLSRER